MDAHDAIERLREALAARNRGEVTELSRSWAADDPPRFSPRDGQKVLAYLRAKRCFNELVTLGAALSRAYPDSERIRRLYAQGLIDAFQLDRALEVLEAMVSDPSVTPEEREEAVGLIGRVHKQKYVDSRAEPEAKAGSLRRAFEAYAEVWNDTGKPWHGINVVALIARAERDGITVPGDVDPAALARTLREGVEDRIDDGKADVWDYAIAMEASLALGDEGTAVGWAEKYVEAGVAVGRDEFEFGSTLRQLREVWGRDVDDPFGSAVIPMLEAVVLDRGLRSSDGSGAVQLETVSLSRMGLPDNVERLERVFGPDSFVTIKWLQLLSARLQAIGSVATKTGAAFGTGFMVRGSELSKEFGDDWVFVTNSHVVTDDAALIERMPANGKPRRPEEVRISFEVLFGSDRADPADREYRPDFGVAEVLWTSPPEEFDVTILRLDRPFYEGRVEPYPITEDLPDASTGPRLYIAGHPGGQNLRVSLHDNHLIEFDDRRMLYRTPTQPGSSGSPVFNDQWDLVGLHHAGSAESKTLDGSAVVEANRGIRIKAIIEALRGVFAPPAEPAV